MKEKVKLICMNCGHTWNKEDGIECMICGSKETIEE